MRGWLTVSTVLLLVVGPVVPVAGGLATDQVPGAPVASSMEAEGQSDTEAALPHGAGHLEVTPAPPWRPLALGQHSHVQELEFVCPEPAHGVPVGQGKEGPTDVIRYGCPLHVRDGAFSLGNGAIAVHHKDHREVVFTSLHAKASPYGPFDHAREGPSAHTAFPSDDQGLTFDDQPPRVYHEPSGNVYGTDTDVVLDDGGHVVAAYLYHEPVTNGTWQSIIGLFKGGKPSEFDMRAAYEYPAWIFAREPGNMIEKVHLIDLAPHTPVKEVSPEPNETAPAANRSQFGQIAYEPDPQNATSELIAVTWHETALDPANASSGMSGWIDLAWTSPGGENTWERLPEDQLIGPCSASSEMIQWASKLYVACVVDQGYTDRSRARIGDVDLWEVDLHENTTRLVGYTGVTTRGQPMLAQATTEDNTYVGLLTWHQVLDSEGNLTRLQVNATYGWLSEILRIGGRLSERMPGDLGIDLRAWGQGDEEIPLRDAHVTAFELTDDTFQSLLVYQEWHETPEGVPEPDPNPGLPPEPDPEEDLIRPIRTRLTDYTKFFVAFNWCDGVVAGYEAELGSSVDQYNHDQYQTYNGVFNEPRDGLFKTREPSTREELVYFAIGDYGAMQYGAVRMNAVSSLCPPPPVAPFAPAVTAPQALTAASGVSMAMAAGFAVPATAMIMYALAIKKRSPAAVAAEDE